MWTPPHNCYPLHNRCARSSCPSWLSFISIIFQAHLGTSCLQEKSSYTKFPMRPMAITLNYSFQKWRTSDILESQYTLYVGMTRTRNMHVYNTYTILKHKPYSFTTNTLNAYWSTQTSSLSAFKFNKDNLKTVHCIILAWNWCLPQHGAVRPLSIFIASNLYTLVGKAVHSTAQLMSIVYYALRNDYINPCIIHSEVIILWS